MLKMNYGNRVIVIPGTALEPLKRADAKMLRALLILASAQNADPLDLGAEYGLSRNAMETAMAFWQGAGVLENTEEETTQELAPAVPVPKTGSPETVIMEDGRKVKIIHSDFPVFSQEELNEILKSEDKRQLVEEGQQAFGRVFNIQEVSEILGLSDYLGYDGECVLSLVAFGAGQKPKSVHNVVKMAYQFYDDGIRDADALHDRLLRIEQSKSLIWQFRKMLGTGERQLSTEEQKAFDRWTTEYQYGMDEISLAFDISVKNTSGASIPYMETVLGAWAKEGLRGKEQIQEYLDKHKRGRKAQSAGTAYRNPGRSGRAIQPSGDSSFDPEEFLNDAINRSRNERKRSQDSKKEG